MTSSHVETLPYHDLPLTDSSFIFPRKNCTTPTTPTICLFAETTAALLLGLRTLGGKFLQVEEDLKEAMLAHLKKETI